MGKAYLLSVTLLICIVAGAQVTSNGTGGGLWNAASTWAGGIVPVASDKVTIQDGDIVTINTDATVYSLAIGQGVSGTLIFTDATAQTLTVQTDVTVAEGGIFRSAAGGTVTTHILSIGGDLINNGTLDFSTNSNTAGAGIVFTGSTNNTFGGQGNVTDIRRLTINKGSSNTNILQLEPSNFTVQGFSTDGTRMAFLVLQNGTFKISGSFSCEGRVFTANILPATCGFWLDNPNFTVSGQNNSIVNNGLLRITNGIFNAGVAINNNLTFGLGASFTLEGGAVNVAGRFSADNAITYTQSGGALYVSTAGNNSGIASFSLRAGMFALSGGSITIVQINSQSAATSRKDFYNTAMPDIKGGSLFIGTGETIGNSGVFDFRVYGIVPAMVIDNTLNNKSVTAGYGGLPAGGNAYVGYGGLTINPGTTFSTGGYSVSFKGDIVNDGILNANQANSRFAFTGASAQVYSGSGLAGTSAAPFAVLEIDNEAGVVLDPQIINNIVTSRVIFLRGGLTNSNKITLGAGGTTTSFVQIGDAKTPTNAGTFDVSPVFNVGSGGQSISYLKVNHLLTTGPEINPSRILTSLMYDGDGSSHSLTIAGGDLSLSSNATALTLNSGRIITGNNTLILSSATATVSRNNGYVDGNLRKSFGATGSKTFEVGTSNGYSPVAVNVTEGSFPATFAVKAVEGPLPGLNPAKSLQRYWTLTATGSKAGLTFNYLDPTDIPSPFNENDFVVIKYADGQITRPEGTVDVVDNIATVDDEISVSDWTLTSISEILPVRLISFSGSKEKDYSILKWITANETNNRGFEIQRSADGVNFKAIGFVASRAQEGNSTHSLSYIFTDHKTEGAKQYYRLRQIDKDGNETYSNVLLIRSEIPSTLTLRRLFPNPVTDLVNIAVDMPVRSAMAIVIADNAGNIVQRRSVKLEAGYNVLTIYTSHLPKGIYTVLLFCEADSQSAAGRFIK